MAAFPPASLRLSATSPALAGETVTVSWDAPDAEGIDEMELVLSLDGGRTWSIRITGDLSPRAMGTSFRVPSLPTGEASVALRAGRTEERASEAILAESPAFRIVVPASWSGEVLSQVRGEWRTVEAMEGQLPDSPGLPGFFGIPSVRPQAEFGPDADGGADEDASCQEVESLLPHRPGARYEALRLSAAANRPLLSRRE